jgi:serine/threonine protein kinase
MPPDRRAAFLREACGSDRELREQIEAMLEGESGAVDFLNKPLLEQLAGDMAARPAQRDLAGSRFRNYEVMSRLGAGGIGEVWLARDSNLKREVALKLLSPRFAGDPHHVRRFQQEARAASSLNHPNIVTVYEIGETEGVLFIAQERVAGETIRQRLMRGTMDFREILEIAIQTAAALGAAHSAGVVHRDIKPENVMIRPDGLVKVLDFGLARFVERPTGTGSASLDSCSVPGFVLGTVRYMSPEQARGLPVDGRSDIFSLGVMLYEMAAGSPPFSGLTPTDTLAAILANDPPPLSRHARGIPARFERLVQRCLAKDPAARYASAEELRDELKRLTVPAGEAARPWKWQVSIAAACCAMLAVLGFSYLRRDPKLPASPFNSMQITRLETRSEPEDVALSPDGKLLAYVANDGAGQNIRIRNSSDSTETVAVRTESGQHSGLVFSPDNAFLYYRRRAAEEIGDLYRVPLRGGASERVIGEVSGAGALSPDGRRVAFVRLNPSSWEASLHVSNTDGSGEFTLATVRRPRYFDEHGVAWSPDGRSIACFTGGAARYSEATFHLVEVSLADRSRREITAASWMWPRSVAWSRAGDVLIVTAATRGTDGYQLWMAQHGNGAVTRLTNDLTNYDRVTIANDGKTLATVQRETSAGVWVAPAGDAAHAVRAGAVALHSTHVSVAWTPEERLVYSDAAGGDSSNLWVMDADGRNQRPLTMDRGSREQVVMSRDGRYLVYKQAGNIWRMGADGGGVRRLTEGPLDVHPDVTPDGRAVIYASYAEWSPGIGGEPTLWRVPMDGGKAEEITRQPASWPRVSGDGKQVGCIYFPGKDPRFSAGRLAIMGLDGTGGFRFFEVSPTEETLLAWSPVGKALDYIVNADSGGSIRRQPSDGSPPTRVASFGKDHVYAFAWSKNGRFACIRGTTTRGVVLIENFH